MFDSLRTFRLGTGPVFGWAKYHSLPPPQPEGCDYILSAARSIRRLRDIFLSGLSLRTAAAVAESLSARCSRGLQPAAVAALWFHAIRIANSALSLARSLYWAALQAFAHPPMRVPVCSTENRQAVE